MSVPREFSETRRAKCPHCGDALSVLAVTTRDGERCCASCERPLVSSAIRHVGDVPPNRPRPLFRSDAIARLDSLLFGDGRLREDDPDRPLS